MSRVVISWDGRNKPVRVSIRKSKLKLDNQDVVVNLNTRKNKRLLNKTGK